MKNSEITIAEAINLAMSKYKGGDVFKKNVILEAWKRVVPTSAHSSIKKVVLNDKTLTVFTSSPILRHSLSINRETLLRKLNAEQDKIVMEEIVFM